MKQFCFEMPHHRETVCCLPSYPTRKASGIGQVLPLFPLVGLRPPRLEQLVKLSASMSTMATKRLPGLRIRIVGADLEHCLLMWDVVLYLG